MLNRAGRSLTARVIVLSSLWAVVALAAAGGLISKLYEQTAAKGFEELLTAQLYNLVNSVGIGQNGSLSGSPDLGDLRYVQPLSGWYWEVLPASENTRGRLSSGSLGILSIPEMPVAEEPFDPAYRRTYEIPGLDGETLKVLETEVVLDAQNHAARFRVMGNASVLAADMAQFDRTLALYLGAVGLGTVLVNVLAILFGLRPLREVRGALSRVRTGRAERLTGRFPSEIEPLAVELNALIDNNRRIVERSRTQVGNLAHSLKTPIAVLVNEAEAVGGERGRIIADQSERMRQQVQHYLDRARVAAQSEGAVFRTPVQPVLERLARVIAKLNPHLELDFDAATARDLVFAGEQQDLEEMVGNLLENAGKWARGQVRLSAVASSPERLAIVVEDDGPGLTEAEMAVATKRGRRLDEAVPGSGLGLSIVSDMVAEYRGTLGFARSALGGLRAEIALPRALGSLAA
ncbi:ATP-binding protein [Aurantimonas endophytica]|uniref:histidine kinase n=1 Tax=Aurantimonas endophytica TaxID=1522175 RepID=A0A7W6MQP8_9HYPH|nr:ATP-binding protein [Aurantimonas endophytica]MBB4004220.1 signal transduction histidine kinase [Aurantimonas endophytica]MCO6405061.1 histidine kinase [Aurantimonas endophytica]